MLLKNLRDGLAAPRNSRGDFKLAEILLKSLREHAIIAQPASRDRFQLLIAELNRKMVSAEDDTELVMIAGAAVQAMKQYETESNAFWQAQIAELQSIVATLTSTLTTFGERHSEAADRLVDLEHSLKSTSALEDLRAVRQKIEECVKTLQAEHQHQRETKTLVYQALQPDKSDPATGLGSRQAAEKAIVEQTKASPPGCLALFVVHRIQQVNARYGHAVGDEMLNTFLGHLAANLEPSDQLFRWSGPAFLAIVSRDRSDHSVDFEMRRIASFKLDKELEIRDRCVMVPLSASVFILPLTGKVVLASLTASLDQFASSHLQR